jgi:uncharacterized protein YndB with AHSA1/START domain
MGRFSSMKTWTATTIIDAGPEAVLDVLTDPDAVARWAPLPFDVEDLDTPRLMTGSRARVSGRLAGRRVGFDVEVHEAVPQRLALAADGPVGLDVAYDWSASGDGSEVRASISVRSGKGFTGRLIAEATNALLSAGALTHAISRLGREAACPA